MKMKTQLHWSFSTLGCPELDLDGVLELARENGIRQLELRTLEKRVDLPALFRERYGKPEALRARLDEAGLGVVSLDTSWKLVGSKEEDRTAFLEFIEWAEELEVPWLRVFDGGSHASELSSEDLKATVEAIAWWRDLKNRNGWKTDIMVETHDCLTASPAIEQLQEALATPVGMLWDTHHTWKKGGEGLTHTWERIRENVVHVHIKDSISVPSARHPFTYVLPGQGEFPLAEAVELFERDQFAGVISLEWERQWHPYLQPVGEALRSCRQLGWW